MGLPVAIFSFFKSISLLCATLDVYNLFCCMHFSSLLVNSSSFDVEIPKTGWILRRNCFSWYLSQSITKIMSPIMPDFHKAHCCCWLLIGDNYYIFSHSHVCTSLLGCIDAIILCYWLRKTNQITILVGQEIFCLVSLCYFYPFTFQLLYSSDILPFTPLIKLRCKLI